MIIPSSFYGFPSDYMTIFLSGFLTIFWSKWSLLQVIRTALFITFLKNCCSSQHAQPEYRHAQLFFRSNFT